jgi:hypothetical protein
MFKWLLFLVGGDEPEAWGGGVTRKNEAITMTASAPTMLLDAVEIDVSYPFIASSSSLCTMEIDMSYVLPPLSVGENM